MSVRGQASRDEGTLNGVLVVIIGLAFIYVLFFMVSGLAAVWVANDLAKGRDLFFSGFFLAFRYVTLAAGPVAGLLYAWRKRREALLVILLPILIFGGVCIVSLFQ